MGGVDESHLRQFANVVVVSNDQLEEGKKASDHHAFATLVEARRELAHRPVARLHDAVVSIPRYKR